MSKIRVMIADDKEILRKMLWVSLGKSEDMEVVGEARDGEELVSLCEEIPADIIVVDIEMPKLNGLDASRIIKKRYPEMKILVLTTFDTDEYIQQFLEVEIDGYLLKGCDDAKLIQAVKSAYYGVNTLDRDVLTRITEVLTNREEENKHKKLTPVEQKVAKLIVK